MKIVVATLAFVLAVSVAILTVNGAELFAASASDATDNTQLATMFEPAALLLIGAGLIAFCRMAGKRHRRRP